MTANLYTLGSITAAGVTVIPPVWHRSRMSSGVQRLAADVAALQRDLQEASTSGDARMPVWELKILPAGNAVSFFFIPGEGAEKVSGADDTMPPGCLPSSLSHSPGFVAGDSPGHVWEHCALSPVWGQPVLWG